jgi:hypothetical protein
MLVVDKKKKAGPMVHSNCQNILKTIGKFGNSPTVTKGLPGKNNNVSAISPRWA